jgi:hypothetical protein
VTLAEVLRVYGYAEEKVQQILKRVRRRMKAGVDGKNRKERTECGDRGLRIAKCGEDVKEVSPVDGSVVCDGGVQNECETLQSCLAYLAGKYPSFVPINTSILVSPSFVVKDSGAEHAFVDGTGEKEKAAPGCAPAVGKSSAVYPGGVTPVNFDIFDVHSDEIGDVVSLPSGVRPPRPSILIVPSSSSVVASSASEVGSPLRAWRRAPADKKKKKRARWKRRGMFSALEGSYFAPYDEQLGMPAPQLSFQDFTSFGTPGSLR